MHKHRKWDDLRLDGGVIHTFSQCRFYSLYLMIEGTLIHFRLSCVLCAWLSGLRHSLLLLIVPVHWAVPHRSLSRKGGRYASTWAQKEHYRWLASTESVSAPRPWCIFDTCVSKHFAAAFLFLCLLVSFSLSLGLMTAHTSQCVVSRTSTDSVRKPSSSLIPAECRTICSGDRVKCLRHTGR